MTPTPKLSRVEWNRRKITYPGKADPHKTYLNDVASSALNEKDAAVHCVCHGAKTPLDLVEVLTHQSRTFFFWAGFQLGQHSDFYFPRLCFARGMGYIKQLILPVDLFTSGLKDTFSSFFRLAASPLSFVSGYIDGMASTQDMNTASIGTFLIWSTLFYIIGFGSALVFVAKDGVRLYPYKSNTVVLTPTPTSVSTSTSTSASTAQTPAVAAQDTRDESYLDND
ncbi:hypothetical protein Pelo_13871 [Pelomyxa schiedti]|nr:hypothetical protein Pelo_13871 [Pelomyxa schiedti]